jgi:hypothetical protein
MRTSERTPGENRCCGAALDRPDAKAACSIAGHLRDCLLRAVIINQALTALAVAITAAMTALLSARGEQGLLCAAERGVIGKERIGASDQAQVMAQLGG